jgi:hypothetical protein
VSPTLKVNPRKFPCNFFGDYKFIVLQLLSLTKWFFIQLSIIHDNIPSQVAKKRRQGFGQWINSSIIHDNICSLIRKNCHLKRYPSDKKYHMKLNTICIVDAWRRYS